ncbi:MAG: hypothetical protein AAGD14_08010 [Planctomycetota bacterium]
MITWDSRTIYEKPVTGVCEITGAYETGRLYTLEENGKQKRIFIGNTAAPDHVHDYIKFLTHMGTISNFKASTPKADQIESRVAPKKKKK